jgi:heat shock protein HtpX
MGTKKIQTYKLRNRCHTLLLLLSMAVLLGLIGWMIAGMAGLQFAILFVILSLLFTPHIPTALIMNFFKARPFSEYELPQLFAITRRLSQRAGLKKLPLLYYSNSRLLNAFAVGTKKDSAILISDGLLRLLNSSEIEGIMGHEITHIKNNDTQVMQLAGLFTRLTSYGSLMGQMLLLIFLPVILITENDVPFMPLLLLAFAPGISSFLNLALSRTREFEADLGGAILTGNPYSLATALDKIESHRNGRWYYFLINSPVSRQVDIFNTHPPTKERINRLLSMATDYKKQLNNRYHVGYNRLNSIF